MKQAIVTGATGYIGSYFVEYLTKKGIEVLALGRKDFDDISKIRQKKLKDAKYLKIDMSKIENLKNSIKEIHWNIGSSCVFINLAWGGKSKLSDLNVRNQMMNVIWCVNAFKIANDLIFIMLNYLEVSLQVEDDTHSIRHIEVIRTLAIRGSRQVSLGIHTAIRSAQPEVTARYRQCQSLQEGTFQDTVIKTIAHS